MEKFSAANGFFKDNCGSIIKLYAQKLSIMHVARMEPNDFWNVGELDKSAISGIMSVLYPIKQRDAMITYMLKNGEWEDVTLQWKFPKDLTAEEKAAGLVAAGFILSARRTAVVRDAVESDHTTEEIADGHEGRVPRCQCWLQ